MGMDSQRILELQAKRGAKRTVSEANKKSLETVVIDCRRYLQDRIDSYRNLEAEEKKNRIKQLILSYVMGTKNLSVEGFTNEDGRLDTNKLVDELVSNIQNRGILTAPLEDPSIYEIRANGKEIWVEQSGRCKPLTDENGNIVSFSNPEEQETIIRKLLGDVRLSAKYAVISTSTIEGFRIAATHSSALGSDPSLPGGDKYHAFVLRKFNKIKMDLSDIARKKTISDDMARFLAVMVSGGLTFFTCGPTASGKSTTNNAILQYVPYDTRVILLQNPSEIDLRFKDPSGRVINDVVHMEYIDKIEGAASPYDPTSENLNSQILRFSPTFVAYGEWRTNKEFKQGIQISQAGHPVNSTLHAENSKGAIQRILVAYMAASENEPADLALQNICEAVNIIIIQKIMRDGIRRVLQVSEILGVDPENPNQPEINDLYRLVTDGEPVIVDGRVVDIPCHHERVGTLSSRTVEKLKLEAVPLKKIDFLLEPVKEVPDKETYTGDVIREYAGRQSLKKETE